MTCQIQRHKDKKWTLKTIDIVTAKNRRGMVYKQPSFFAVYIGSVNPPANNETWNICRGNTTVKHHFMFYFTYHFIKIRTKKETQWTANTELWCIYNSLE